MTSHGSSLSTAIVERISHQTQISVLTVNQTRTATTGFPGDYSRAAAESTIERFTYIVYDCPPNDKYSYCTHN